MGQAERPLRADGSALERFGVELRRWRKNAALSQARLGALVHVSADLIQKIEIGRRKPSYSLARDSDAALGARGGVLRAWQEMDAALSRTDGRCHESGGHRADPGEGGWLSLESVLDGAMSDQTTGVEPLAAVLAGYSPEAAQERGNGPADIATLTARAERSRRTYQACGYTNLLVQLPDLLADLDTASRSLDDAGKGRARILAADAYHVAAGLLLKLGDQGLAFLAADRSMRAAEASQQPVMIGASARIVTHALMGSGHLSTAVATATSHADRLDRAVTTWTPECLSVYGSLLLRGAIAAAHDGSRAQSHDLLAEADSAGQRLGTEGNFCWTAFGPANVRLHRVHVAVSLGDAGTAIDLARGIDPGAIIVAERKASLLIDVCRAFLQWGRHEKAYLAIRAAESIAHQEVAGRRRCRP